MSDIISESGLSAGAIYSHFASKADLVRFTTTVALESRGYGLLRMGREAGHAPSPHELTVRIAGFFREEEISPLLLQIWAEASRDPDIAQVVQENLVYVRTFLARILTPWAEGAAAMSEDSRAFAGRAADMVLAMVHGFLLRIMIDPGVDKQVLLEDLLSLRRL